MPRIVFDQEAFMAIPGAVIVGERDTRVDASLNMNPKITAQQGENRVERGRRWVSTMIETARQRGMPDHFSFSLAPRCGHSFNRAMKRGGMGEFVFTHLFGATHSS